mmetsp:Transcript_66378/g.192327  ORF Transcript_66378/g.192327 Transcript_66378/m.192327 type:complete len:451 (-) Transcript_66378:1671-3023(-)
MIASQVRRSQPGTSAPMTIFTAAAEAIYSCNDGGTDLSSIRAAPPACKMPRKAAKAISESRGKFTAMMISGPVRYFASAADTLFASSRIWEYVTDLLVPATLRHCSAGNLSAVRWKISCRNVTPAMCGAWLSVGISPPYSTLGLSMHVLEPVSASLMVSALSELVGEFVEPSPVSDCSGCWTRGVCASPFSKALLAAGRRTMVLPSLFQRDSSERCNRPPRSSTRMSRRSGSWNFFGVILAKTLGSHRSMVTASLVKASSAICAASDWKTTSGTPVAHAANISSNSAGTGSAPLWATASTPATSINCSHCASTCWTRPAWPKRIREFCRTSTCKMAHSGRKPKAGGASAGGASARRSLLMFTTFVRRPAPWNASVSDASTAETCTICWTCSKSEGSSSTRTTAPALSTPKQAAKKSAVFRGMQMATMVFGPLTLSCRMRAMRFATESKCL